jgi:hypothetical protein
MSTRQQQAYVSSDRRPVSGQTTRPVSAEPAQTLLTDKNLRSAAFTSAPAHRQPSAEKLSWLPACCLPNPACHTRPTATTSCVVQANSLHSTSSSASRRNLVALFRATTHYHRGYAEEVKVVPSVCQTGPQ